MPLDFEWDADAARARLEQYRKFGKALQQEWRKSRTDVTSREARETAKAVEAWLRRGKHDD